MTCNKTEKLEGTQFQYINNCCKSILAKLRLIEQCHYLNERMIKEVTSWIDFDVDTIQENCIDLLDSDE